MGKLGTQILFFLFLLLGTGGYYQYIYAQSGVTYFISPSGSDSNPGTQTQPFQTIQKGLSLAQPGDTIQLSAGDYYQDVVSVRDGQVGAPIMVIGPSDAVIKGAGNSRVFEINHNYHSLQGFTIDGLHGDASSASGYRDKLLFVHGKQTLSGVTGLLVTKMQFKNAGGECLRLRYFVTESEISYSNFQNCGVHDFRFNAGGKNGEAVYIGTSSNQWSDGKNPTSDPDESNNNWVHHNTMNTQGNECVDIKEGASDNIIEYNDCTGQKDQSSAGFDSRGDANIFRYNTSKNNLGAGIRLGGHIIEGKEYGQNNSVYGNVLTGNQAGGIKFQVVPQANICGNTAANNTGGVSVGSYGDQFQPSTPCLGIASPNPSASPDTSPSMAPSPVLSPSPSSQVSPSPSASVTPSVNPSSSPLQPTPSAAPTPQALVLSLGDEAVLSCSGSALVPTAWQNNDKILTVDCLHSAEMARDLSPGDSIIYTCPEGTVYNQLSADQSQVHTLCLANSTPSVSPSSSPPISSNVLHFGFQLQGLTKPEVSVPVEITMIASGSAAIKASHTFVSDSNGILRTEPTGMAVPTQFSPGRLVTVYAQTATSLRKKIGEFIVQYGENTAPDNWSANMLLIGDYVDTPRENSINLQDIASVLSIYTALSTPVTAQTQHFDVNYDGVINLLDISLPLSNYTALEVVGE